MQGRFLDCARNDGMGGWITHVPYKGYVGETPLPQRHPERSRGIFFVGGKRERARQREMGNTVSRKGGDGASPKRLSEGGGKRGRKRFLAALEMTVWGNGYPLYRIKCALGNAFFPYRHPERSRGIFFVGGKRERARQRGTGNTVSRKGGDGASPKRLSEGGGKRGRKRFLAALEMTVWGNGYPLYRIKCALGNAFFPYRHPERSRGIFFVGGKRERARQRGTGNTVSRKGGDGASRKRLSEGVMEKRNEKDFYLRLKQCGGRSFLIEFIYAFFARFL